MTNEGYRVFTIGYGNRPIKNFIEILQEYKIQILVDVRTYPHSRFRPEYNLKVFEANLKKHGIDYYHRSDLGGKPKNDELYDEGVLNYQKLSQSYPYQEGIKNLDIGLGINLETDSERTAVIMCSELDYSNCHRYHLISEDMVKLGWTVLHIDKQGKLQQHEKGL